MTHPNLGRYIASSEHLKDVMSLLRDPSASIQYADLSNH